MFDLDNEESLRELIDKRNERNIVIPLYVTINGHRYGLWELDQITSFSPSFMKVGFGSSFGMFVKSGFPTEHMYDFTIQKLFDHFDYDENVLTRYIVFESGELTEEEMEISQMYQEIQLYINGIGDKIEEHVKQYRYDIRKRMMEDDDAYLDE